jgi:hypothetical protein
MKILEYDNYTVEKNIVCKKLKIAYYFCNHNTDSRKNFIIRDTLQISIEIHKGSFELIKHIIDRRN